jgi:hypothetical protein
MWVFLFSTIVIGLTVLIEEGHATATNQLCTSAGWATVPTTDPAVMFSHDTTACEVSITSAPQRGIYASGAIAYDSAIEVELSFLPTPSPGARLGFEFNADAGTGYYAFITGAGTVHVFRFWTVAYVGRKEEGVSHADIPNFDATATYKLAVKTAGGSNYAIEVLINRQHIFDSYAGHYAPHIPGGFFLYASSTSAKYYSVTWQPKEEWTTTTSPTSKPTLAPTLPTVIADAPNFSDYTKMCGWKKYCPSYVPDPASSAWWYSCWTQCGWASVQLRPTGYLRTDPPLSVEGFHSVEIKWTVKPWNMEANAKCRVGYKFSTESEFTATTDVSNNGNVKVDLSKTLDVPAGATAVELKLSSVGNSAADRCYFYSVKVLGHGAGAAAAVPVLPSSPVDEPDPSERFVDGNGNGNGKVKAKGKGKGHPDDDVNVVRFNFEFVDWRQINFHYLAGSLLALAAFICGFAFCAYRSGLKEGNRSAFLKQKYLAVHGTDSEASAA